MVDAVGIATSSVATEQLNRLRATQLSNETPRHTEYSTISSSINDAEQIPTIDGSSNSRSTTGSKSQES